MSACTSSPPFSLRSVALAFSLSGSLLATSGAWAEPVSYMISAGSLTNAINTFSAASGVTVSFSSEETAGLSTAG